MECERCNRQLSMMVDGRLSGRHERRLQSHLAGCRRCREDLAELRKLRVLLGNLASPEPSPEFWSNTMGRLRQSAQQQRMRGRLARPLRYSLGLSTAMLLIVVVFLTSRRAPISGPTITMNPASLVSLHAIDRARHPLADAGEVGYVIGEADDRDLADDSKLDAN